MKVIVEHLKELRDDNVFDNVTNFIYNNYVDKIGGYLCLEFSDKEFIRLDYLKPIKIRIEFKGENKSGK